MSAPSQAQKIAALNDAFRSSPMKATHVPGTVIATEGIASLDATALREVLMLVREFEVFNEDNDPHGEHDFGAIDHPKAGKVFWKIDYYEDANCEFGSAYPEDPHRSYRVLTIMLAEEY